MGLQHVQRAQVFAQPVGQRAIELQPVAVGPHAAVADQVARVLHGEQVLAGRHRLPDRTRPAPPAARSRAGSPASSYQNSGYVAQRLGVGDRGLEVEAAVGIDGELRVVPISFSTASMRRKSSASGAPPIFIFTTV